MTKDELITQLKAIEASHPDGDAEDWHAAADHLLIAYINDPEVETAYSDVPKWYA